MTRRDIADYLLSVLSWPGVKCDTELLAQSVVRWEKTPGLGFVDAYLAAIARRDGCPVYTKNVRELASQGVMVPNPLPSESEPSPAG
jgi:predicted nucleic acid-binding protein